MGYDSYGYPVRIYRPLHICRTPKVRQFIAHHGGTLSNGVPRILGMDLVGDRVQKDVAQVTVSFSGHRLLDPGCSEAETRRQLKRRAFDHLLSLALTRIAGMRVEREDLKRQRDLLRRKLAALEGESVSDGALTYINRLSDLLFVMARVLNQRAGASDVLWQHDRNETAD